MLFVGFVYRRPAPPPRNEPPPERKLPPPGRRPAPPERKPPPPERKPPERGGRGPEPPKPPKPPERGGRGGLGGRGGRGGRRRWRGGRGARGAPKKIKRGPWGRVGPRGAKMIASTTTSTSSNTMAPTGNPPPRRTGPLAAARRYRGGRVVQVNGKAIDRAQLAAHGAHSLLCAGIVVALLPAGQEVFVQDGLQHWHGELGFEPGAAHGAVVVLAGGEHKHNAVVLVGVAKAPGVGELVCIALHRVVADGIDGIHADLRAAAFLQSNAEVGDVIFRVLGKDVGGVNDRLAGVRVWRGGCGGQAAGQRQARRQRQGGGAAESVLLHKRLLVGSPVRVRRKSPRCPPRQTAARTKRPTARR